MSLRSFGHTHAPPPGDHRPEGAAGAGEPHHPLFQADTKPSEEYLYDLRILRETLEEILASGRVPRRASRAEQRRGESVVYDPLTTAQRARWSAMVGQLRAEETRVRQRLDAARAS